MLEGCHTILWRNYITRHFVNESEKKNLPRAPRGDFRMLSGETCLRPLLCSGDIFVQSHQERQVMTYGCMYSLLWTLSYKKLRRHQTMQEKNTRNQFIRQVFSFFGGCRQHGVHMMLKGIRLIGLCWERAEQKEHNPRVKSLRTN